MPGLAGFTAPLDADSRSASRTLDAMLALLVHTDRDHVEATSLDGGVCAGRVRTGIFSPGGQPFRIEGVRVWLDGELTDGESAAGRLGVTASSDAELLARLYTDRHDFTFLRELDGFFAAVVHDRERQEIHLVTDRYGYRHLYWGLVDRQLVWSSELKAFTAVPSFTARVDDRAVGNFFHTGYLLDDRTWFEGVSVLSMATVLTFHVDRGEARQSRYWDFGNIRPQPRSNDPREYLEEWHRRFEAAVARRCRGRVGVMLSGGLDSRAVAAALPEHATPGVLVTMGQEDSADVHIARRVAKLCNRPHHVQRTGDDNWLEERFAASWWIDGQLNLIDIHGAGGLAERRRWFDINLSGFIGDLTMGGSHYGASLQDEFRAITGKTRRQTILGIKLGAVAVESRMPFVDYELFDFTYGIARELRRDHALYKEMLLRFYPRFYRSIPWQSTGVPIAWPAGVARTKIRFDKLAEKLRGSGVPLGGRRREFSDYAAWLRRAPERERVGELLTSGGALYPQWQSREEALDAWNRHLAGEDHTRTVGRYLALEVWLQQIFGERLRPPLLRLSDGEEEGVTASQPAAPPQ